MNTEEIKKEADSIIDMFFANSIKYDFTTSYTQKYAIENAIKHIEGLIVILSNGLALNDKSLTPSRLYFEKKLTHFTQIKEILTKRITQ